MPKFDAVVIGAGNGGLTAACRLAKAGKKTLLIERHNLPGGVASSFRRGRFEFETALHELCDLGSAENPGATWETLVNEFGLDIDWYLVPDNFRVITTARDGSPIDATLPCGRQAFIDKMEDYVPGCKKSVTDFFDLADETVKASAYMTASNGHPDVKYMKEHFSNFMRTAGYPVNPVLRALKIPDKAQDILTTYWGYLGVDCDHLSFMHYANMVNMYISRGAYIPGHTSHELNTGLLERFRAFGGEVWMNCTAKNILFDGDHVSGVVTTQGTIETRYVVCNGNPSMAYASMLPRDKVPEREVKLANARRYSARMFVLYVGLDASAEELGIRDYSLFLPHTADSAKEYASLGVIDPECYTIPLCYNIVNPHASPEGTCMMSFTTTYMEDCWAEVDPKDYVATKNRVAEGMIDFYEKATGVHIKDHIEEMAVATPWTFCNYANVPQGAAYGYELRDWDAMMARMKMLGQDYPIKGLKFCGAAGPRGDGFNSAYFCGDLMGKLTLKQMKEEEGE